MEEGTEFDGYDRNDYFATISCPHCGETFKSYNRNASQKYKKIDYLTKLNIRK